LISGGHNVLNQIHVLSFKIINQAIPNPNCAPACEYVAIPDGSASDAPVIIPGPNLLRIVLCKENDDLDNLSCLYHPHPVFYLPFSCLRYFFLFD
jgi:hypothetical protein